MSKRLPSWILPAFTVALIINGVLFLLPPLLSYTQSSARPDLSAPIALRPVLIREKEPPLEKDEEIIPPEPEILTETAPDNTLAPDLVKPELPALDLAAPQFDMDLAIAPSPHLGIDMVFYAQELDQPPRLIMRTAPIYPYKAKRLEIEGYVKVRFLVDEKGRVSRISIIESSPPGIFEASVLNMLPSWKFEAGTIVGEKVASWVEIPVRFELR